MKAVNEILLVDSYLVVADYVSELDNDSYYLVFDGAKYAIKKADTEMFEKKDIYVKKIFAHLPLNFADKLKYVDLLPPIFENLATKFSYAQDDNVFKTNYAENNSWYKGFLAGYFHRHPQPTSPLPIKFIRDLKFKEIPQFHAECFEIYFNSEMQTVWSGTYIIA